MSVNTAHADNGVLIHAGENIILFSDNVNVDLSGQDGTLFKGTKNGKIYLTTHRIIFNNRVPADPMRSFSMPFVCLSDVEVEQPIFGPNYIRGKVRAQANGNFTGEAKFKLSFKAGGAIDFAQCALKAAYICKKYGGGAAPPPYQPPSGAWHQAPPPAYSASPMGYYGWVPQTQAFPHGPPPDTVYMSDSPPPYPGIVNPGAVPTANGYAGGPPTYPGNNNGLPAYGNYYPGANGTPGAPMPPNGGAFGYNAAQGPPANAGFYPPPANGAAAAAPWANPAAQPGMYPSMPAGGSNSNNDAGYPGPAYNGFQGAAGGKENEAAQSAHNPNPYLPQPPNAPPPEYNEPPPSYNSLPGNKKQQ